MRRRKCAFTHSRFHLLVEIDGKLGYDIDGEFIPICDAPKKKDQEEISPKERLKRFLDECPRMRELVDAGSVFLEADSKGIYCHSMPKFFKEYSETGKTLKGAELDAWAQAKFEENERILTDIKADLKRNGGRFRDEIKSIAIPLQPMKKKKPAFRERDMVEELVYR